MTIVYDQVVNYIASKPANYLTTMGNTLTDLNLNTKSKVYDNAVGRALSELHSTGNLCGKNRLILVEMSPKYARGGKRPTNLYRIVEAS